VRPGPGPLGSAKAGDPRAFGVALVGDDHDAVAVRERALSLLVGIAGEAAGALATLEHSAAVGADRGIGRDRSGEPTDRFRADVACFAAGEQGSSPPPGTASWPDARDAYARTLIDGLRRVAPGFTDDVILASLVRSPPDIEAANPHMIDGTFHGGDRGIPFSGALRPRARVVAAPHAHPGLYQTGGTTHPGGSITGGPGRNAAIVILQDLGTSLEEVVAGAARQVAI
jgi:hypothetical protein